MVWSGLFDSVELHVKGGIGRATWCAWNRIESNVMANAGYYSGRLDC